MDETPVADGGLLLPPPRCKTTSINARNEAHPVGPKAANDGDSRLARWVYRERRSRCVLARAQRSAYAFGRWGEAPRPESGAQMRESELNCRFRERSRVSRPHRGCRRRRERLPRARSGRRRRAARPSRRAVGAGRAGARGTLQERARRTLRDADGDVILPHAGSRPSAHLEFNCQALCSHAAQVSRV
jgi:hypothetical protein